MRRQYAYAANECAQNLTTLNHLSFVQILPSNICIYLKVIFNRLSGKQNKTVTMEKWSERNGTRWTSENPKQTRENGAKPTREEDRKCVRVESDWLEQFSVECRQTKTKGVTLASHKGQRQSNFISKSKREANKCSWRGASENILITLF